MPFWLWETRIGLSFVKEKKKDYREQFVWKFVYAIERKKMYKIAR